MSNRQITIILNKSVIIYAIEIILIAHIAGGVAGTNLNASMSADDPCFGGPDIQDH
jgi:hypothetical protein